jgi:hypothetical protein
MAVNNSQRFWRMLSLLARLDIAAGIIITLTLLATLAGR